MTPDEPVQPPDTIKSRADLQAELRKVHKTERKHRHRWRRRILYGLGSIVLIAALGAGGLYVYATYKFDQIKKVHAKHLVAPAPPGKPFNILLVGSDSRAFVQNATQIKAFGSGAAEGGQRSDVTMVARFVPATKSVTVLSIPRDLWVDIPGNGNIQGLNRINAAFDVGPDLLIQTIEKDLNIPINHYVSVNFDGFQSMVDALGGITMDFPTPVKDSYSGLNVSAVGCQLVPGPTALELVRARHLQYKNSNGYWQFDGLSDFSRIQRQDAFFRAVLAKLNTSLSITNVFTINSFINAAVGHMTIDDALSRGDIFDLANTFKGLPSSHLITETLPVTGFVTDGGADVLKEAQPYADAMINAFNQIGEPANPAPSSPLAQSGLGATTTSTTAPAVPRSQVVVRVFNASTVSGIAHTTATGLTAQGFTVGEIADAPRPLASGSPSEIHYGPAGYPAAQTLGTALSGPVTYVADPTLTGQTVSLLIAGSALSVTASSPVGTSTTTSTTTTTTTAPAAVPVGGSTTTTTIPGNVYTNTQLEPWNPYPCTIGAPTQATPTTPITPTTTTVTTKG